MFSVTAKLFSRAPVVLCEWVWWRVLGDYWPKQIALLK